MRILLLLANPDTRSFSHALADRVTDTLIGLGHEVTLRDLCAEDFPPALQPGEARRGADLDPVIDQACIEAAEADGFVIIHPNWWGMPPAVLVGWIDRVLRPGVAYEFLPHDSGEGVPHGLLRARAAVVLNTSNTFAEREARVFGDPLERIWRDCVFGLCGVEEVHRRVYSVVVSATPDQRTAWLDDASMLVAATYPEA